MCLLLPQTAPALRTSRSPPGGGDGAAAPLPARPAPSLRACWRPATLLRRSLCHPSACAKASPRWSFGRCLVSVTHCSARRSNVKVERTTSTLLVMGCRVGFGQAAPEACSTLVTRCSSGTRRLPADSSSSPYARPLRASPCDSTRPTCPRGRDPRFRAPPAAGSSFAGRSDLFFAIVLIP